ncbi:hypothetical protein DO97_18170 [Neosynechococcus sphagnicola sy1]|uniref:Thylakoid lumen protein n=1 Tax=Neosynechococcus sphagnicola sy1 TaxID=1497020 RepID=A0A098TMB1_9CYAN|nr:hypothetical protein [Neosynechococcus sphagnicola]KGF73455.1 hypothetical protein DO97_18170 [Neosynechococcus sphagnicola sy1]
MNHSPVQAFFLGKAVAETCYEQVESTLIHLLSEIGKFDAEQREHLSQVTEQVTERARQAEIATVQQRGGATPSWNSPTVDLQERIDELRAEVAQLRAELKRYRSPIS